MYKELMKKAMYARNSRSLELLYYVQGAMNMAYNLKAITSKEFWELNRIVVREGINNPRAYDDI